MPPRRRKRKQTTQAVSSKRSRRTLHHSLPAARRTFPTKLQTLNQIKERKGVRGKSLLTHKGGRGNYSIDEGYVLPTKRAYTKEGKKKLSLRDFLENTINNLNIIRNEIDYMKRHGGGSTSPSFHVAIELIYHYMPRKEVRPGLDKDEWHPLDLCSTAWACFKTILEHEMTSEEILGISTGKITGDNDELQRVLKFLDPVQKIIEVLSFHSPQSEQQRLTQVRQMLEPRLGKDLVNRATNAGFHQSFTRKQQGVQKAKQAKEDRVLNQTTVNFINAMQAGLEMVKSSRKLVNDVGEATLVKGSKKRLDEAVYTLTSTVMYAIGSRMTEVVILSDYKDWIRSKTERTDLANVTNNMVTQKAPMITISPVAKDRDAGKIAAKLFNRRQERARRDAAIEGKEFEREEFNEEKEIARQGLKPKTSDRVILFGATPKEIQSFVALLRRLLPRFHKTFKKLDKNSGKDRATAVHLMGSKMGDYLNEKLLNDPERPLNETYTFTMRSLRALYVAISYRVWAKQPTSEIMWINAILGHSHIATSVSYNTYALSKIVNVLDRESVDGELAKQMALVKGLTAQIEQLKQQRQPPGPPPPPQRRPREGKEEEKKNEEVLLSTTNGYYRSVEKMSIQRRGLAEKLERLRNVLVEWVREGIAITSRNLRNYGFSSKVLKEARADDEDIIADARENQLAAAQEDR